MSDARQVVLSAEGVTFGFLRRPDFLGPVSLEVETGHCWGIIGPNGAGKSTLLRLAAGLILPKSGVVSLDAAPLGSIDARTRARRIAFLPQNPPRELGLTVREVVLMGRYPHRQFGLFESHTDLAMATDSLDATDTTEFADRTLATLSGGEAQRVHVAAALAQQPGILMLDEPTSALDLYHQLAIFTLVRRLVDEHRIAAMIVTHDLNLAARYCTHVLLLDDGKVAAQGPPAEVIAPARLEPVYGVRLQSLRADGQDADWIVPIGKQRDQEGQP